MRYQLTPIIIRKTLAVRSAFVVGVLAATFACAQPIESFSDHLLNRLAFPTPAAYDARTDRLIVGTIHGDVSKIAAPGNGSREDAERLYRSHDNSILRVRLDAPRQRLWILDIGNVHVFDLAKNRLIRSIALANWYYAGHGANCLPDLQLDPHGAAFVTDTIQPKLWRVDAENFSVRERSVSLDSQRNVDVGFSALAIGKGGVMFAAMAAPGTLWRVDTDSSRAERIPLSVPIHGACAIETQRAAGSRDFTLVVLAAGRASFDVRRIDMRPGSSEARVDTIALGSVAAPASLLARNGALYVVSHNGAVPVSQRQRGNNALFALRPIFRLD